MKPIIFLETEGVLQTQKGVEHWLKIKGDIFGEDNFENFCPKSVEFLNKITDNTEAVIVLTSHSREGVNISDMKDVFKKRGVTGEIKSYTPLLGKDSTKGDEINRWFEMFGKPETFVIIDSDCTDGISSKFEEDRYVETGSVNGLNDRNIYKKILNSLSKIDKSKRKEFQSKTLF